MLLTDGGSAWSRHRQQKRLEKRPRLRGFLEDREGEEPAEEGEREEEEEVTTAPSAISGETLEILTKILPSAARFMEDCPTRNQFAG